jgi:hypothetical protein
MRRTIAIAIAIAIAMPPPAWLRVCEVWLRKPFLFKH